MRTIRLSISSAALVALLLTACGGSDDSAPVASAPQAGSTVEQREDAAASASIGGLVAFLRAQIGTATSESTEPRNVGGVVPPTTDTAEPVPL